MAKRIEPDEAAKLMEQGWTYLDVRSIPEFEQGHPAGAWNIPLMHMEPGRGMAPNPAFLDEVKAAFPTDTRLVIGCKSGGRSARAAQMMEQVGFGEVVDMRGGFSGEPDPAGGLACEGWAARSLPTADQAEAGRAYADLKKG